MSDILADPQLDESRQLIDHAYLVAVVRSVQDEVRGDIAGGQISALDSLVDRILTEIQALTTTEAQSVINGTGIIVHTNLGRSPVSRETALALADVARRYLALEVEPESGRRGGRGREVAKLLQLLTGCEDALIVNNNAAAVTLTLSALASEKGVIISRGEAVEIGGGFRIPEVLQQSGARLVEVGTTNRTHLRDYERAVDPETAALMKVHASNFAILGFTAQPDVGELSELAHGHGIYMIEDAGSGCLVDPSQYGLAGEPLLQDSISAEVDVVTASGDKLLGGPQAGLILGKRDVIDHIRRHPLARAVRVDKSTQAGVAATLRHYVRGDYEIEIPIWWSISRERDWLRQRVGTWLDRIEYPGARLIETEAAVGGGSLPGQLLPSFALALEPRGSTADELARALRTGSPSVFPRIIDDLVAIDARTVLRDEDDAVVEAVHRMLDSA